MSWSLRVSNGDLMYGNAGLATVSGGAKLTQDLRCALLESMGHDSMHPSFGSILDGGTDVDGTHIPGIIGEVNNNDASIFIQSEIQRICRNYQSQQIARNQADVAIYGKSTLTADEALLALGETDIQQAQDQVLVTINLTTGTGGLPVSVPFSIE